MRAHTIITMSRRSRQRRRRALALAIGVCALVIPSTASAGRDTARRRATGLADQRRSGGSNDSSQASWRLGLLVRPNSIVGSSESQPVGSSGSSDSDTRATRR